MYLTSHSVLSPENNDYLIFQRIDNIIAVANDGHSSVIQSIKHVRVW